MRAQQLAFETGGGALPCGLYGSSKLVSAGFQAAVLLYPLRGLVQEVGQLELIAELACVHVRQLFRLACTLQQRACFRVALQLLLIHQDLLDLLMSGGFNQLLLHFLRTDR